MTRRSRSSASALEENTFTGRIVSITPNDGRRLETCEILMKVSAHIICKIHVNSSYSSFVTMYYRMTGNSLDRDQDS